MIRLRTLGTLDLRDAGGDEVRAVLAQPRRAALLAYLALAAPRGAQRRDTILALFWPELDTDRARNALGQAVHFLRRSLGADAVVNRNGDGIAIDWTTFWCDAAAFEEALDADRVGEAIAHYRGDLLEGFHISDAPDFERWLDAERARLAARYTKAVEMLAAAREVAGDFHGATLHWRSLAARDPYSSRLTLRLMRALKAAGDPAEALAQARNHQEVLRAELGIAPDGDIDALVRELQARPKPPAASPLAIPQPVIDRPGAMPPDLGAAPRSRTRAMLVMTLGAVGLIAGAILLNKVSSDPRATAAVVQQSTGDVDRAALNKLIARGREFEISRSQTGLETAQDAYERAIAKDSMSPLGYAGLASVLTLRGWYAYAPVVPALDSARMLALRAFALDSSLSETHTIVGRLLAEAHRFTEAESHMKRAIEIDSTDGRAHYWYASVLLTLGRGEEAMREAIAAEKFDPLGPKTLAWKRHATWVITGRRPDRDLPPMERRVILKHAPDEPWALSRRAADLAEVGDCTGARRDIDRAQTLAPGNVRMRFPLARVEWWCDGRARSIAILNEIKSRPDAREFGYEIAGMHAFLGQADSAFTWLDRHRHWTMLDLTMLSVGPLFDPVRADKRFPALLKRLGLRDSVAAATLSRR